jgi:hypothetical protein
VSKSLELATRRLDRDFIIGLQSDFDASMLLFEAALGWSRVDTVRAARKEWRRVGWQGLTGVALGWVFGFWGLQRCWLPTLFRLVLMPQKVYSLDSMVLHSTSIGDPLVAKLEAEWHERGADIEALLRQRFSPLDYHNLLFEHGVKV